jgi:outer membrane protein TolC
MAKMTLLTLGETVGIKDLKQIILPKNYVAFWEKKKIPSKELSEFMETAINQREDLKAIQASSISATKSLDLAESKYLPSIDFIATYTRNFQAKGLPGYGSKEVQDNFFYGLQLNWDILDWGVRQSQISQAFETKGTLSLQEEQSRSQIKIDVTNSFFNLKDAYQTLDSAKVSVDYAKDVYLQMEAQFNNGQATTTDVLAAADDQSSALAKLANATGDLDLAWLNLQKSIGKRLTTLNKG